MVLTDKKVFIVSTFSLNMLALVPQEVLMTPITLREARELAQQAESAVSNLPLTSILSHQLGLPIPVNPQHITLDGNMRLLVGWYIGPQIGYHTQRLPQGGQI